MKRVIGLIICILMTVNHVGVLVGAQEQENYDTYKGFFIEETENIVYIIGYNDKHVVQLIVPSSINNKKVELGARAFRDLTNLETVTFHAGITYLSTGLFEGNMCLKNVYLPNSVTAIYDYCFKDCTNLMGINLNKVEVIGRSAFEGCSSLSTVIVSDRLESIDSYGFKDCNYLTSINLKNVKKLGSCAFEGCSTLTTIRHNGMLSDISEDCFKGCENLKEINGTSNDENIILTNRNFRVVVIVENNEYEYEVREYKNGETYVWIKDIHMENPNDAHVVRKSIDGHPVLHGGELYADGFYFVLSEDKDYAIITGICENMYESDTLYIPSVLKGYPVKGFSADWKGDAPFTAYDLRAFEETPQVFYENNKTDGIVTQEKNVAIYVNRNAVIADVAPYIKNDRTLVPMRVIFEALGAEVSWDDTTKTAIGVKDGIEVKITIGENVLYKNGEAIELDCATEITNDRTMVPVRAISEAFGCTVNWNNETKTVEITN